jgi:hypothetical protein
MTGSGKIITRHGLLYNMYTDDTSIDIFTWPLKVNGTTTSCVPEIKSWLHSIFFQMNDIKLNPLSLCQQLLLAKSMCQPFPSVVNRHRSRSAP